MELIDGTRARLFLSQEVIRTGSGIPLSEASESALNEKKEPLLKAKHRISWFRQRASSSPPFAKSENRYMIPNSDVRASQISRRAADIKSTFPGGRRYGTNFLPKYYSNPRLVYFKHIPDTIGLRSIIAQVHGGPLSKISLIKSKSSSGGCLELHFLQPTRAVRFSEYASSGRFLINGTPYFPTKHQTFQRSVSRGEELFEHIAKSHARRCLTIAFPVILEKRGSPFEALTGKYFNELIGKFSKFGQVVMVSPMISKNIAICIQFADIKDSLEAKKAFEMRVCIDQ
jgi:hypothetical protein